MKSRADWGNRQGNCARCFLYFLIEINSLSSHFKSHQPPHIDGRFGGFCIKPCRSPAGLFCCSAGVGRQIGLHFATDAMWAALSPRHLAAQQLDPLAHAAQAQAM